MAAELAERIVDGEFAECIPIVLESPNIYMFDYNQMQRFGIPKRALPVQTVSLSTSPGCFYIDTKASSPLIKIINRVIFLDRAVDQGRFYT